MKTRIIATVAFLAALALSPATAMGGKETSSKVKLPPAPSMREAFDKNKFYFGAAVMPDQLDIPEFAETMRKHFNYVSPENNMKWTMLRPSEDVFDFDGADRIVQFAMDNNLKVRGHTLLWHIQNPEWINDLSPKELEEALKKHIKTVVGRYKGKIRDWDVVNEPFEETGAFRNTIWREKLGPDYIEKALRWAHEVDPSARLFINEYGFETGGTKADAFYRLAKDLVEKGAPLHGLGFQYHLDGREIPDWSGVTKTFKRFAELGLELQVTEIDVRIPSPADDAMLQQQAMIYGQLLNIFRTLGVGNTYIAWGVTDAYSWIPGTFEGMGSGLVFDEDYAPKPAFDAIYSEMTSPRAAMDTMDKFLVVNTQRTLTPFRAPLAPADLKIDGKVVPSQWAKAPEIPLFYNQLNGSDQRYNPAQARAVLRMMYRGTKLYGWLQREDKLAVTDAKNVYENSNFELFYNTTDTVVQIRTVVGQDWQDDMGVDGVAVWSKDLKNLTFEVNVSDEEELTGRTIGFLAAYSHNDGKVRASQLYPITGNNTAYKGRGIGELTLAKADGSYTDGPLVGDPFDFQVIAAAKAPLVNGDAKQEAWKASVAYPLAYNLLEAYNQAPPVGVFGDFRLLIHNQTLYGLVTRTDSKPAVKGSTPQTSDGVEIMVNFRGKIVSLWSSTGGALEGAGDSGAVGKWSADGNAFTFSIPLPGAKKGESLPFSVGSYYRGHTIGLYPFTGYARSTKAVTNDALGQLMTKKAVETASAVLQ